MWVKRYYVLKDSALIAYREANSRTPSSNLYINQLICFVGVIYLNGLYIDSYFTKGIKGFRIFHNSDYFKEKVLYHKDAKYLDKWIEEVKSQAFYYEVNKRYEKISTLGKGKFSTVYLCRSQESDEYVAMKLIDKKQLSVREREFLIDEIQIIGGINHPNIITIKESFETLQHMYIMMESMQGGELFDHIKEYEISGTHINSI